MTAFPETQIFAYLTATLTAIVNGHKQGQMHELLP
ncbi:transposase domain-containing protein [Ochrobactrum sp. AN78]|nr:hypothetical protein [Ochrobactrum sp. AN78]